MPSAKITLPDGTVVNIDGTPEEVAKLLAIYGGGFTGAQAPSSEKPRPSQSKRAARSKTASLKDSTAESAFDLNEIVNLAKNCDEAEAIESAVLDRASQVNRILLQLYIVHEHLGNNHGLTSGEISHQRLDAHAHVHALAIGHRVAAHSARSMTRCGPELMPVAVIPAVAMMSVGVHRLRSRAILTIESRHTVRFRVTPGLTTGKLLQTAECP